MQNILFNLKIKTILFIINPLRLFIRALKALEYKLINLA
jgi:hypothetical protein